MRALSEDGPARMRFLARIGQAPHYPGTTHDDATARAMGFPAALVPGAFVFGAMSSLAVHSWGADWLHRGALEARFRSPCFDADLLTLEAEPLAHTDAGLSAPVTVTRPGGTVVATGTVSLLGQRDTPDPADYPVLPLPAAPPALAPGGMRAGTPLGSHDEVLDAAELARALVDFGETWPGYAADSILPVGRLLRVVMRDTNRNWRLPSPVVLTACAVRNLAPARAGQRIATAGRIAAAWERRGNHYYEGRQLLTADRHPAALFRCTMIYAAAPKEPLP